MTLYAYQDRDGTKLFESREALDRWVVGSFNLTVRRLVEKGEKRTPMLLEFKN